MVDVNQSFDFELVNLRAKIGTLVLTEAWEVCTRCLLWRGWTVPVAYNFFIGMAYTVAYNFFIIVA